ncbi:IS110 family transposase [Allomesorhizobium camelthorni]|uniref:IS110 family transposase n=1 Tax=Allomesorhizobium camelthorni TaxID=475069 RepID=A0A6G4WQ82_9HYPH|nr:IS110 family transposase [Mesorhizobium camelthorni]NGO56217.1 IS110 family transposase [Mesorhizobium camelthorni]
MHVVTIGLDLAKNVFQVHGIDGEGRVVVRRRLRRTEMLPFFGALSPCRIGMEACSTAHHWARELMAFGHDVRLMPASYVKPYVKRGKNDANDAEAICEAVTRPTMRFVPVKSIEQQSVIMLHRTRDLLVRQRTMLVNALRGHLAEVGIVAALGLPKVQELISLVKDGADERIEPLMRHCMEVIVDQLQDIQGRIGTLDRAIHAWHRQNETSRRLETIPGVGPITASVLAATVTSPSAFSSGRHFAAWLGLVPRQNSTGGKDRHGKISKMGDQYIRRLLIVGAHAVLRWGRTTKGSAWIMRLLGRRPFRVVAVALANKMARIVWCVLAKGSTYRNEHSAGALPA